MLAGHGLGFDGVSGGELAVLRAAGVSPESVYFHGNNKSSSELREAVAWGIGCIVVDGFRELELVNTVAGEMGRHQPIMVRVSPDVDPHTHNHKTTEILGSKFGIPMSTVQARTADKLPMAAEHLDLRGQYLLNQE